MDDVCVYRIEVRGKVDEDELNARGPLQVQVVGREGAETVCRVGTDQAGLIGLMRHLHGRGFVFLSVRREGEKMDFRRRGDL
jgi:hypothetical protein